MGEVIAFEQKRRTYGVDWALQEASMHFQGRGAVHETMRRIARRLDDLGIPYAVVGGMAVYLHGLSRTTDDVNLLVTPGGLATIHQKLEGLGYIPLFRGSKNLRDTESGVKIEFLVAGQFPGDGLPKPVAFPDPTGVSEMSNGVRLLRLPNLVELKLASAMTNSARIKDLGDVQELIKLLGLPLDFAEQLNPFVREQYRSLWHGVHNAPPGPQDEVT